MTLSRGLLLLPLLALLPLPAEERPAKPFAPVLEPFVQSNSLAGAVVLVADKDKVLAVAAVGLADIAGKRPMQADSLFWIASQTKPITAVALLMLVDEGKVKLDDPVAKYLPEFKELMIEAKGKDSPQKPKQTMTVRHLLTHTSGMPFQSRQEVPTLDVLTLRAATESYAQTHLHAEPGMVFRYSNAGINTAGRIIEVVAGMPYEDFMDRRLFVPLGMKDTTFWPSAEQLKRLAKPYKPTADKKGLDETTIVHLRYPLSDRKRQPMPAGGLFSTAGDVAKFCQMMLNGGTKGNARFLSEASVKELTSRQTPAVLQQNWGLGFALSDGGNYGHGGALATNMNIDPKRGLVTVWLVQQTGGFPNDGGKAQGAFRKAAEDHFSPKK